MSMSHIPTLVVTTWPTPSMVFPDRPWWENNRNSLAFTKLTLNIHKKKNRLYSLLQHFCPSKAAEQRLFILVHSCGMSWHCQPVAWNAYCSILSLSYMQWYCIFWLRFWFASATSYNCYLPTLVTSFTWTHTFAFEGSKRPSGIFSLSAPKSQL